MTNLTALVKQEQSVISNDDNLKGIENHKKAAQHHEAAAKHHLDAAKHHEAGNHDKASQSTIKAHGQHVLAGERLREDTKHHALKS